MASFRITVAGDSALNVEFGTAIAPETGALVRAASKQLEKHPIAGTTELLPTFCSLRVCYDPLAIGFDELAKALESELQSLSAEKAARKTVICIPVCYGGSFGPDIETVARHAGLTIDEVIALHSGRDYLIDMLGFLPGFAYLGGLDKRLHTPRLATPRTVIEAGSVGIGGAQTGIYPLPSPGGWQLIGRTPLRPYDPARETPILYQAGDYLRFVPIAQSEYRAIEAQLAEGTYRYCIETEARA